MGSTETSLLDDLDAALQGGSSDKRVDMLKRVTNLFVSDAPRLRDRKSTRLNSSHITTSYAVFCLKKKRPTRIPWYLMYAPGDPYTPSPPQHHSWPIRNVPLCRSIPTNATSAAGSMIRVPSPSLAT